FIDQRGHELSVTYPQSPIFVEGDRVRLAQVFMNLLNNAAKYTPDPGHIWLSVEQQGDHAMVRIKDTGMGIAPESLPHLFELFYQADRSFTRAEGGLGLGLTLVQRMLEMHGGTVKVYSAGVDKGSEFTVTLPLSPEAPQQRDLLQERKGQAASTAVKLHRVLVADDFPQSAETLAQLLRQEGHEVQIAQDGLEAFETAACFHPDVIVLDIAMPTLNGYEAARKIRQQPWGKKVFLIALTGWGQQRDRHRTREAGFDAHLAKPVKYQSIIELLDKLSLDSHDDSNKTRLSAQEWYTKSKINEGIRK
ncbi:MAG: ATP-binding response regulator, partial [Candidatus Binatia bacterium]